MSWPGSRRPTRQAVFYLSIEVEPSFQDIAETADPAKISEQLRHANEQLELTRQRTIPVGNARSPGARSNPSRGRSDSLTPAAFTCACQSQC